MKLTEQHYTASRGDGADDYQSLDVVKEAEGSRNYLRFKLMEQRWRSPQEAADYLRWAADQVEGLK